MFIEAYIVVLVSVIVVEFFGIVLYLFFKRSEQLKNIIFSCSVYNTRLEMGDYQVIISFGKMYFSREKKNLYLNLVADHRGGQHFLLISASSVPIFFFCDGAGTITAK